MLVVARGVFVASCRSFIAAHGLSSGTRVVVMAHGPICFMACGILVPRPLTEPRSPVLEAQSLTTRTGSPEKFLPVVFLGSMPSFQLSQTSPCFRHHFFLCCNPAEEVLKVILIASSFPYSYPYCFLILDYAY